MPRMSARQLAEQQLGPERRLAQLRMGEPQIIAALGHMVRKFVGEREAEPERRAVVADQIDAGDLGLLAGSSPKAGAAIGRPGATSWLPSPL